MNPQFTYYPVKPGESLPKTEDITSVAVVVFDENGDILATKDKERGWDIPGGHIEAKDGGDIFVALDREVMEETGAKVEGLIYSVRISSNDTEGPYKGKSMVIFAAKRFTLNKDWTPHEDVEDRGVMPVEEMLAAYKGDLEGMKRIIELAREALQRIPPESVELRRMR